MTKKNKQQHNKQLYNKNMLWYAIVQDQQQDTHLTNKKQKKTNDFVCAQYEHERWWVCKLRTDKEYSYVTAIDIVD